MIGAAAAERPGGAVRLFARWVGTSARALGRCAALSGLGLVEIVVLLLPVSAVVVPALWPVVLMHGKLVGVYIWVWLVPSLVGLVSASRWLAGAHRRLVGSWHGEPIESPYRPQPKMEITAHGWYWNGYDYHKYRWLSRYQGFVRNRSRDPATWRDLGWTVLMVLLVWPVLVPVALAAAGLAGLAGPVAWAVLPAPPGGMALLVAPVFGVVALVAAGMSARFLPAGHLWAARRLLGRTEKSRLSARVEQLAESRRDATDAEAAELRRIERDLHDGAQARLVAVGMTLGAIERLMDTDPAAARELLARTRETSAQALQELRDLVRGIHPPVLSERGLADAVRALGMDLRLPVRVTVEMPGRLDPPVESAAYFAVSEALANATKHAQASQITVDLAHRDGLLRIVVTDDGCGGANPDGGSGLRGVRRRLGTFDGTLAVTSPPGGPTVLTMEIPCALSSPRTSSSSERD